MQESRLKYSVKYVEHQHLAVNGTELVIGEITGVYLDEIALQSDGFLDLQAIETVAVTGLDSYHTSNKLTRLAYAKK